MACYNCSLDIKIYAKCLCKKCYKKQWHFNNRELELLKYKKRHLKNKALDNHKSNLWYQSNKDYHSTYTKSKSYKEKLRLKYDTNIQYRLRNVLRARLRAAIKTNQKVGSAVKDLGCSIDELKLHLELQFKHGMSWNNYGKEWQIDHIKPLFKFDLSAPEQLKEACNYKNLQPIFIEEHVSKTRRDVYGV